MNRSRFVLISSMILLAAASRLIPHPPNFAPITALALFSGAKFSDKRLSLLVPLTALIISDTVLGFYKQLWVVYGCFCLIVCIGFMIRKRTAAWAVAAATVTSSILFFVLTNFGVWALGSLYSKTLEGLIACYVAAIPFFQNAVLGDVFYAALLFMGFRLAEMRWPAFRETDGFDGKVLSDVQ
jgi:hypothetical protein